MKKETISIDLGGTFLRVSRVKGSEILNYQRNKTPKTKEKIIEMLVSEIKKQFNSDTKGIGIACAGAIDTKTGIIKRSPNLPLENFNFKTFLKKKFKIKVEIENDANCVALAEEKFGCKKTNFFVLTLGTGIGGGIILNGKLYKGLGYAGELGHIILDNEKDFESLAASRKRKQLTKKYFGKDMWVKDLINSKDKNSKLILQNITKYLGQGIASLISVFDPEIVILGGGACECGDKFLNLIKKQTYKHNFLPRKTPIKFTKLKHAGTLGASLLVK